MALTPIVYTERVIRSFLPYQLTACPLAELYGVETRVLVQAVKCNLDRFPRDFMFQLTKAEFDNLQSQDVTSSTWGGPPSPPDPGVVRMRGDKKPESLSPSGLSDAAKWR
jgi:hypothetical protein